MLIIHGKKRVEKKLGYVADFCPACHEIRCFTLKRVSLVKHIYYIPIARPKLVQHLIECTTCGLWLGTDPATYKKVEEHTTFRSDVETLLLYTHPNLREKYASRLAFETRLKKNPDTIEPAARAQFVFELFRLVNPQVEACYKRETHFDKPSGIGCLGTVILSGALIAICLSLPDRSPRQEPLATAALLVLLLGGIYSLIQFALVPRRKLRNRVLPMLARGLHPLDPREGELAAVLQKCKSTGLYIGKKLKLPWLMETLRNQTD